jgi:hypothetical protein
MFYTVGILFGRDPNTFYLSFIYLSQSTENTKEQNNAE